MTGVQTCALPICLSASVDLAEGSLTLRCSGNQSDEASHAEFSGSTVLKMETMDCLMIAASEKNERQMHFNGKIDNPTIYAGHLDLHTLDAQADRAPVYACWDFSRDISSCRIVDSGPNQLTGALINFPARAMTGANWDGTEMCWRHLPHQYGAIHFHRSEEHTSELQSHLNIVCRLLLEKKKILLQRTN